MLKHFVLHRYIALGLTLGLGISLSVIAANFVKKWESANYQTRFQRQTENLATAIQRSLNRYTDVLASLSDYYTVAQLQVERKKFAGFVQRSLNSYPGIQALEWAPLVRRSQRLTYEQQMQAAGYQNFQITELAGDNSLVRAGDRPYYIPVIYVEPFVNNEVALGYDLNSNSTRAAAIQQARDTGEVTATGRIRLVQKKQQFGFLVFLPVYLDTSIPDSLEQQRERLEGFLLGVFQVSDVVEEALQGLQYDIDFALYDQSASPKEQFLGFYDATRKRVTIERDRQQSQTPHSSLCPVASDCKHPLTVGQRQWLLVFSPSRNYLVGANHRAIATLFTGFLLTGSLVFFLHTLNNKLERTRKLSELKLRFFSMASHELRTPLSTILLSSESLQVNCNALSEAQKRMNIQRIHLAAKHMSQQIADILTLTRAEVGKLEFSPELFDLETFCQQLVEEMQVGVSQTIVLTSNCQNTRAFLDKKLLRSLLTNLLSNAIKYSPDHSSIQFTLNCDSKTATFQICDQGIGIPVEDQLRIFETFYRGSNVGSVLGTGLGLAVVKTCVELHRGQLTISSEGEGAIATVTLPME